jgi:hypothetical protein
MTRILTILLVLSCFVPGVVFGVTGVKGLSSPSAHPDTSSPDAWGYTWVKSTDPGGPAFQWVDITTTGTLTTGLADDNSVGPFPIQFAFPYYWYDVTTFRIGSNGYVTFGNQSANFASPFAQLPNTSAPNDMLAICTGDLDFTVTSTTPQCYYWTNGVDSLVVSYINVAEWRSPANPNTRHTFQVILNKQDSSITYQYGPQQGRFDDGANNYTLCIGIENQTGQIGLSYAFSSVPPHALMPDSGLAIRIKRTTNTGLQVRDAGIVGGFNVENLGKIIRQGVADTIVAVVRNFGTADLTDASVTYQITKTGQTTVRDTVVIGSFPAGQTTTIVFPRLFTPLVVGTYTATFAVSVTADVGPSNNSKVSEIVSAAFSTSANTYLAFETGVSAGSTSWTGGGGFGIDFEIPVSPVRIDSVYIQIATVTAQPMTVEILEGAGGVPGEVLATKTVTAFVGNNGISFRSDSIDITSGRFFVGARGQLNFSYETTAPISFRTWEYTNGYAPYRSRDIQDIMIRAVVRQEDPFTPTTVSPGWNMISNPVTTSSDSVTQLFPTSLFPYGFGFAGSGGYQQAYVMANGVGYWGKFPAAAGVRITGGERTLDTIDVEAGWNMVGSLSTEADTSSIVSIPAGLRSSTAWFGYSGGYTPAPTIQPGKGYWVKANATGVFIFTAEPAPEKTSASGNDVLGTMNSISIRDGLGHSQTLYFGAGDGSLQYEMPPVPPEGAFDARFETAQGGAVLRTHAAGAGLPIAIRSAIAPLTVSWNIKTGRYALETGQGLQQMSGQGTYTLAAAPSRLILKSGGSADIPTEYALMQNYPNPFNPSTTIRYALPVESRVSVEVFNAIGQRVKTLASGTMVAGYQSIEWNGTNGWGQQLGSGVYFVRFAATGTDGRTFGDTRKLMLLK